MPAARASAIARLNLASARDVDHHATPPPTERTINGNSHTRRRFFSFITTAVTRRP